MRVLAIYSTDELLGGGEISFTLSLRLVQEAGWEVLAVVPGYGPLAAYLKENQIPFEIASQESLRSGAGVGYLFRPKQEWLKLASSYRPNLIHCNAVRPAIYGQALGRALKIPTIFHARKSESDGLIDYFLMLRVDAIICITEVVRRRFPRWLGPRKLRVIYNAVDLERFREKPAASSQIRRHWLRSDDGALIGIIGRLSPIKGQDLVIHAAPEILRAVPDTRFVFVGSEDPSYPGYESALRQHLKQLGLEGRFVFAGFHSEIECVYHALDLVVFPTSSEGFGRVIIEAGAARKPLVASDIAPVREVLSADLHDLTVPVGQAGPLVRRIIELLRNEELRLETARRLHEHVSAHFGLQAHRDQLLAIYRELS